MEALFKALDVDHDGILTADNLLTGIHGIPMPTSWQLLMEIDTRGDGEVDQEQFIKKMKEILSMSTQEDAEDPFSWLSVAFEYEKKLQIQLLSAKKRKLFSQVEPKAPVPPPPVSITTTTTIIPKKTSKTTKQKEPVQVATTAVAPIVSTTFVSTEATVAAVSVPSVRKVVQADKKNSKSKKKKPKEEKKEVESLQVHRTLPQVDISNMSKGKQNKLSQFLQQQPSREVEFIEEVEVKEEVGEKEQKDDVTKHEKEDLSVQLVVPQEESFPPPSTESEQQEEMVSESESDTTCSTLDSSSKRLLDFLQKMPSNAQQFSFAVSSSRRHGPNESVKSDSVTTSPLLMIKKKKKNTHTQNKPLHTNSMVEMDLKKSTTDENKAFSPIKRRSTTGPRKPVSDSEPVSVASDSEPVVKVSEEQQESSCLDIISKRFDSLRQLYIQKHHVLTDTSQQDLQNLLDKIHTILTVSSTPTTFLHQEFKEFSVNKTKKRNIDVKRELISIEQIKQATRVRAFRKQLTSHLFPQVKGGNDIEALSELFPDLHKDTTIQQMYDACDQDLTSCFEVLSGLSELTPIEKILSPRLNKSKLMPPPSTKSSKSKMSLQENIKKQQAPLSAPLFETKHTMSTSQRKLSFSSFPSSSSTSSSTSSITSSTSSITSSGRNDQISHLYTQFEQAETLEDILETFHQLANVCKLKKLSSLSTPLDSYRQFKNVLLAQINYRQSQLFRLLDTKIETSDIYRTKPAKQQSVCIIGAGPVGLRSAIEMVLLGAKQIVLIEQRKEFTRENILHLWPWVVHDLTNLGTKILFPKFCVSSSYFHIGTSQLQCILLKIALLLGVQIYPDTTFVSIVSSNNNKSFSIDTSPPRPIKIELTALIGANGVLRQQPQSQMDFFTKCFGFQQEKQEMTQTAEAIGLVVHFPIPVSENDKDIKKDGKEFSWSVQCNQQLFTSLREEKRLDLENIVYYRGTRVHYLIMTPKRSNLLNEGVLLKNVKAINVLLEKDNVNVQVLKEYVKRAMTFFDIINSPVDNDSSFNVQLFDFSTLQRVNKAASIYNSKLLCGLVGDALMEPFWVEGLGINRGFMGALDTCWMISQFGKKSDEVLLQERDIYYRILQRLSGLSRVVLEKNIRLYTVDPQTRYVHIDSTSSSSTHSVHNKTETFSSTGTTKPKREKLF